MPGRAPSAGIELLLDFLNTLDERTFIRHGRRHTGGDALSTVHDLTGWLAGNRLIPAGTPASAADLTAASALRDALRTALKLRACPGAQTAAGPLNTVLAGFPLHARLSPAMTLELAPAGHGVSAALAAIAAAAAAPAGGTWERLKICAATDCRWVFYDTSRNAAGRWCSMRTCGNRDKTKAYRRRQHGSAGPVELPVVRAAGCQESRVAAVPLAPRRSSVSGQGSHQLAAPSSSMTAGTSTIRTMVASIRTAAARPSPICLTETFAPSMTDRNTTTMIAAAAVMTRAVLARPVLTAPVVSAVRTYSSRIADNRKTS